MIASALLTTSTAKLGPKGEDALCGWQKSHQRASQPLEAKRDRISDCLWLHRLIKRAWGSAKLLNAAGGLKSFSGVKRSLRRRWICARQFGRSKAMESVLLSGHFSLSLLPHRFSAFWLRSKCSICSYQLNIWYGGYPPPLMLTRFF